MWEEKTRAGAITAGHTSWFLLPQRSFCHTKRDVLCSCLCACLQRGPRESRNGTGWGQEHNQKEGQGRGDQTRAQNKPPMLDTHPFSLNTTVSTLPLPFCTKGVVRATTGKAAVLSAAPAEPRWAQRSAQRPTAHLGVLLFTVRRAATPAPPQVASSPWIRSNKASHSAAWLVTAFLPPQPSPEPHSRALFSSEEERCPLASDPPSSTGCSLAMPTYPFPFTWETGAH